MLQVEACRILIGFGKRQELRFAIQLTKERQTDRSSRTADTVVIPVVLPRRLRRIGSAESLGRMTAGCPVRFVATSCSLFVGATITSRFSNSFFHSSIASVRARFA